MLHPSLLAQKGAANKVMKEDVFHLNYAFHDGTFIGIVEVVIRVVAVGN